MNTTAVRKREEVVDGEETGEASDEDTESLDEIIDRYAESQ